MNMLRLYKHADLVYQCPMCFTCNVGSNIRINSRLVCFVKLTEKRTVHSGHDGRNSNVKLSTNDNVFVKNHISPRLLDNSGLSEKPEGRLDIPNDIHDIEILTEKVKRYEVRGLPIIHHYDYVSSLPPGHRFAMRKFHGVLRFLKRDNVISMKQVIQPSLVSYETANLVHSSKYLNDFFSGKTTVDEQRRTGFTWNDGLVRRCRLETGGTLLGARLSMETGLVCSTGGGTHHAFPSYGSGFCLLNDMAVTARYLTVKGLVRKVLIVDLDVHQGDGTAHIFENDERVFTFSMHAGSNFPLRKQPSDLDISLPDNTDDKAYMRELHAHLPGVLDSFEPDLIIYDAGVDPHVRDELGKLTLSDKGLYERDQFVLENAMQRSIPCVTVIGGGYSRDLDELSLRHTIVHRVATKIWTNHKL